MPVPVKRRVRKALPRSVRKDVHPGGTGAASAGCGTSSESSSSRIWSITASSRTTTCSTWAAARSGEVAVHRVPRGRPLLRHRPPLRPDRGGARLRPAPARPARQGAGAARAAPLRVRHPAPPVRLRARPVGLHPPERERDHALPGADGSGARPGRQVLRDLLRERAGARGSSTTSSRSRASSRTPTATSSTTTAARSSGCARARACRSSTWAGGTTPATRRCSSSRTRARAPWHVPGGS